MYIKLKKYSFGTPPRQTRVISAVTTHYIGDSQLSNQVTKVQRWIDIFPPRKIIPSLIFLPSESNSLMYIVTTQSHQILHAFPSPQTPYAHKIHNSYKRKWFSLFPDHNTDQAMQSVAPANKESNDE
jgi:hypothetical protein